MHTITYPSGKTVQMFYANGSDHDLNQMFGGIAPEGSYVVYRTFSTTAAGVKFSHPTSTSDLYRLVYPNNVENKPKPQVKKQ